MFVNIAALDMGLSPRVRGNPAPGLLTFASLPTRVYPRVCGGTYPGWQRPCGQMGLSPRVRGNRRDTRSHQYRPGSIPACAGEPIQAGSAHVGRWVYPRVCGGTRYDGIGADGQLGLSLRVRGNRRKA